MIQNIEHLKNLEYGKIYYVSQKAISDKQTQTIKSLLNGYYTRMFQVENLVSKQAPKKGALAARAINIGSIGKYGILYNEVVGNLDYETIRFIGHLTNTEDIEFKEVNDISLSQFVELYQINQFNSVHCGAQNKTSKSKFNAVISSIFRDEKTCMAEAMVPIDIDDDTENKLLDVEEIAVSSEEESKTELLNSIKSLIIKYVTTYGRMPEQELEELIKGKVIIRSDKCSRLVVNNDLKIILPDFDEIEIKMTPINKAIYILFLIHNDGISLKDISEYKNELISIYSIITPNKDQELIDNTIARLVDPMDNSLYEKLSKIKRSILTKILDNNTANNYIIAGKAGDTYKIPLAKELVTLPAIFTN